MAEVIASTVTDAVRAGWMHYDAGSLAEGRERVVKIFGLVPHAAYDVHVAAKDVAKGNAQATVTTLAVTVQQPPLDENVYRGRCRELSPDTLGFMVAEFQTWKVTDGVSAEKLKEREAELNMLFTACRRNAQDPRQKYYTSGGDGYFFGRIGHDVMLM